MRLLSIRIGSLLLALSASAMLWTSPVSGAGSTSYQLQTNFPNDGILGGGTATSYSIEDSSITWHEQPLASTSYRLQKVTAYTNNTTSGGETGGTTGGGGESGGRPAENRRPRPESSSSASSVSSTSSISRSTSSSLSSVGTASSSSTASDRSTTVPTLHPAPTSAQNITRELGDIFTPVTKDVLTNVQPVAIRFFDAVDPLCVTTVHPAGSMVSAPTSLWLILLIALLILGIPALLDGARKVWVSTRKHEKKVNTRVIHVLTALLLTMTMMAGTTHQWIGTAHATQTVPQTHAYNGRLLDSAGNPVTTAVSVRFSYWTDADYVTTDTSAGGSINASAPNYAGWQEVQTVTPNASGYFSLEMGSVTSLPDFSTLTAATLLSLYLQVEVKPQASADTAYELLDSDPTDTTIDRSGILSVPFALNADMIDQREIGTGSGSIAILGPGGKFKESVIPGGTNESTFILDKDNTEASTVTLKFGDTLSKTLTYNISQGAFIFNDDVEIQGDLTVTGLINGIDVSSLGSTADILRTTSGAGLNALIAGGSYRLNSTVVNFPGNSIALTPNVTNFIFFGSGGLTKNSTGFPSDESYIPLSEVTTDAGSITNIADRRIMNSDTREHTVTLKFNPTFEKVSFQADGTNNVGQLTLLHDDINLKNYYRWTSTQSTLQDYDLLVHIPLSPSFVRWLQTATENPISFTYRTSSASALNNKIDLQIYDTSGVPITLSGSVTDLANTSWTTSEIEFTGSPTWTAGQDMRVRIRGFAKDNYEAQISSLQLKYITLGE